MSRPRASRDEASEQGPESTAHAEGDGCESGVQRVADAWGGDHTRSPSPRSRAGWTVLDEYERDGFCYQVLRRPVTTDAPRLTKREAEVLACACLGSSNKEIAYDLGLSPSTVGVLLFRAAGKLGAQSRQELLIAYARWLTFTD